MRIPSAGRSPSYFSTMRYVFIAKGKSPGSQLRQWSSLIGIITAIIGNILISFALNIQRYAHIRLEQEYNDSRPTTGKRRKHSPNGTSNYGTVQEDVAEERARLNAKAPGPGMQANKIKERTHSHGDEADDTHPVKLSYRSDDTMADVEKDGDEDGDSRKSYLRSPYWWLGIILMTVGEAGNFLAYGFAPASIVSPLGVVALISNCVIAPFMLKEHFRQRDLWGVLVAVGGAVTVVLSAKQSETKMGPDDLWDAIKRWEFLTYVGVTVFMIIALMFASPKYGSRTVLIDLGLVGLFGGYTALSTKGVASLLSDTLWRALTFPITYLLIFILILSALMQIRYVNRALQNFDSTQVIPTQFVMFTLSVIIGSAVLYRDFESATAASFGKFIGGCLLTFFGVYLITSGRPGGVAADQDDTSDYEDEGIRLLDEEASHNDDDPLLRQDRRKDRPANRPVSPEQDGLQTPRRGSAVSSARSINTEAADSTNLNQNPLLSSTDHLAMMEAQKDTAAVPDSDYAAPRTPQAIRTQSEADPSTPYFTPGSFPPRIAHLPINPPPFNRNTTTPAAPETPTRSKRSASPPKADPAIRPPPSPHSTLSRSARGSITRLLPGPIMPPLSSSLSGIIAESLRRGEGSPRSLRRNRSSRKQSIKANTDEAETLSRQQTRQTEPESGLTVTSIVEGDNDVGKSKGRLRAVSETLGGLIGRKRSGKGREDEEERGGAS